jgi:hypothetical protein
MRTLRDKLTYANVISTLCLFLLLGGGAYAAKTQLAKNSVGTKQIKNGAITGQKIKNASIDTSKLTPATVTSLKGTKGDPGAVGPRGLQGTPGSPGAYATVVAESPPTFLGQHPGFSAVERSETSPTGVYCLTPEPGINTEHPITSTDWWDSSGEGFFIEPLAGGNASACEEGQLEIRTIELEFEAPESIIPAPTNSVSFTVFLPGA